MYSNEDNKIFHVYETKKIIRHSLKLIIDNLFPDRAYDNNEV